MRQGKSRGVWITLFSIVTGVPVVLVLGLWAYDRWANDVPPFRPSAVVMPSPNGYDRALALVSRLPDLADFAAGLSTEPIPQLRTRLRPALPALDALPTTFSLEWQAPLPLGNEPSSAWIWIGGRYLLDAGRLAMHRGDSTQALQRALDALELAGKGFRGCSIDSLDWPHELHQVAVLQARSWAAFVPERTLTERRERLRRIRGAWPSWTEVLQMERIAVPANLTAIFRQVEYRSAAGTLNSAEESVRSSITSQSVDVLSLRFWLTPKRSVIQQWDRYLLQLIAQSKSPERLRSVTRPIAKPPMSEWHPSIDEAPKLLEQIQTDLEQFDALLAARQASPRSVQRARPMKPRR